MIFVTLGSQKFQFDRLLKSIDELKIEEYIFAQIGYSNYIPTNFEYKRFLDREEFMRTMDKADIVVTHGGTGVIINAVKKRKKVIAIPRLAEYGEHIDNHQKQLVRQFFDLDLIYTCEVEDLGRALAKVRQVEFKEYRSNTKQIIDSVEEFINEVCE